jgi:hypothetical protein
LLVKFRSKGFWRWMGLAIVPTRGTRQDRIIVLSGLHDEKGDEKIFRIECKLIGKMNGDI